MYIVEIIFKITIYMYMIKYFWRLFFRFELKSLLFNEVLILITSNINHYSATLQLP